MNWYYALNGSQVGPVSDQELSRLVAAGTINGSTLVWRDGMGDWQPLNAALPSALGTVAADVPQIGGFAVPSAQKDLVVQQMREGVLGTVPGSMQFAGFWIRFVAKFLDGLILMIPQMMVQFGMSAVIGVAAPTATAPGQVPEFSPAQMMLLASTMGINLLMTGAYNVFLTSKYGATWGKMALGLKVVTEGGGSISFGRAIGRFFAEFVSSMTCAIGYIIAGFDSEKRALHDHICSTRVIKTR